MGIVTTSPMIAQTFRGKWQLPLLLISVSLLVAAVLRIRPHHAELSFEEQLNYLAAARGTTGMAAAEKPADWQRFFDWAAQIPPLADRPAPVAASTQ